MSKNPAFKTGKKNPATFFIRWQGIITTWLPAYDLLKMAGQAKGAVGVAYTQERS